MAELHASAQVWLECFETFLSDCLPDEGRCHPRLREAMAHSLLGGGKRLRPLLVTAAGRLGRAEEEALLSAGAAVEMLHSYSLIHDDLPAMDDDDWRRGRPTCHKVYGEAMAILAGDALQALAFEVLTRALRAAALAPAESLACLEDFARAAGPENLVGGQAGDLEDPPLQGQEGLLWIHERKTAALIRCSVGLGARLAGVRSDEREKLTEAGRLLGLAFQAVDDLLDEESSREELGKTPGKDRAQGKLTMTRLLGAEETRRRAEDYLARALELIPSRDEAALLRDLAERLVRRSR